MELTESDFALSDVVAEASTLLQGQFAGKNQHLAVAVDGLMVRADRQKLLQILLNQLGNAHKFVPPVGHVTVSATRSTNGGVALDIVDDGPGLHADEDERTTAPVGRRPTSLQAH